ncbi:hypothetical protein OG474_30180 [Kribbella sp. NBC_01505]|uniref:hypothetical protein n=1 Tax=Kribbella sp. NBC_01505 TaxID=2903580 RepID=UPI0038689059
MSLYYRALAEQFFGAPASDYAWIIDRDHLDEETPLVGMASEVGVMGPSDAPVELLAELIAGAGYVFKVYDDDGVKYYTGRLAFIPEDDGLPSIAATAGPLDDFGTPNAGATSVRYPGKPEWNCP